MVSKTAVGTASAWWLRVEGGRLRFAVGDELGNLDIIATPRDVADGAYDTVRAEREIAGKQLTLTVDGGPASTPPSTTEGLLTSDEPLCIGAFADDGLPRAFVGDIDSVALRLTY